MIDVDGKDLQESSLSSSGDRVSSVVCVSPRVGTVGEATVGKVVYDALVRVFLRAHENQAEEAPASGTRTRVPNVYSLLQGMRTAGIIENCGVVSQARICRGRDLHTFGRHYKITIHNGSYWELAR